MILQEYLPKRTPEDRLARRVRISLGGETFDLPVLTIEESEAWRAKAGLGLAQLFTGFEKLDDAAAIFSRLSGDLPLQIELVRLYDKTGVLPDDTALRSKASPDDLFAAVLEVAAAAYPPHAAVLELLIRSPEAIRELLKSRPSSMPTNGQQPAMAGAAKRSARA